MTLRFLDIDGHTFYEYVQEVWLGQTETVLGFIARGYDGRYWALRPDAVTPRSMLKAKRVRALNEEHALGKLLTWYGRKVA